MTVSREELERNVAALGDKLVRSFLETIDVLAAVLSWEDRYYEDSHSRFVAEKSTVTARKLGMSESEVFEVKVAALLHDIGKVGFPERVQTKFPPEMSQDEFALYASHPALGKQILSMHSGFAASAEIVHQHHERLDGSGFPRHLKGDEIHPGALIVAVVDAFHNSMFKRRNDRSTVGTTRSPVTSTRSFLESTNKRYSQAMNHLDRKAGILYPHRVVEIFTALMETERKQMGGKVVKRIAINRVTEGMRLAENYYTSYGLLVAARGEELTKESVETLQRFANTGEIAQKVLIIE